MINWGPLIVHLELAIGLVSGPRLVLELEPRPRPISRETSLDASLKIFEHLSWCT